MQAHVTDYALYRWRYRIGYGLVALVVVSILGIAATSVPGALREAEVASALKSGALSVQSLDPSMVINLPYHILQRVCFILLGVTTLSIKLPSIILGALTSIGIFYLTRTWFRRNVAVLATVLSVTTTQFLFLIQDGTPAVLFSFITVWLLTAGTYITRNKLFNTFWKVIGCVLLATALYVPLGIYIVLALLITASFHPHIRFVLRKISRPRLILAIVLSLVSLAPLVYASVMSPSVALTLLGIPTSTLNITTNLSTVGLELFGFLSPSTTALLRPLYSPSILILIIIGTYKLLTVKYTARSYAVLILAACIIPLILLNPRYLSHLYPLAMLMITMGIATLVVGWYKLFPRNPYARVAGLVPLSILVVGLMFSGVMRYMNNYSYNPDVLAHYSTDLVLLDQYLSNHQGKPKETHLVTTSSERSFYTLIARYDKRFSVDTHHLSSQKTSIVTRAAFRQNRPTNEPTRIITNHKSRDADRFYIYTTN